jgi:hypothetical protein
MKPHILQKFFFAAALAAATHSVADTTLVVSSTPLSSNITSQGLPLDSSFTFELGTFISGFVPDADNTTEWLSNWIPLSDASGDPVPEATVQYNDEAAPSPPYSPGTKVNNFDISVALSHNTSPFTAGSKFYVWGFNNRTEDGPGEWILITDNLWVWPVSSPNQPGFVVADLGENSSSIYGYLFVEAVEMQTDSIFITNVTLSPYESWLTENFPPEVLEDELLMDSVWGVLADPDSDGYSNIIEYFTQTSPTGEHSHPEFSSEASGGMFHYTYTAYINAVGAAGTVEWSTDLVNWSSEGITETAVEDEDFVTITASVPMPEDGRIFMRLSVERELEEGT